MKIAVVILNWNGKYLLEEFLPSVISHSKEATIYVADNASSDGSIEFLKAHFPEINIIQNKINAGYAGGYNLALKSVPEEIHILLNSDVEVTENWLGPILEAFENEPETVAIQPKILDYKKKDHFEYAGAAGGYIDKFGYPFCRGRIFQELEEDYGQYNEDKYIFWASGACLAIRKKSFYEIGGLDEDFFAHQEEIDLCWRLLNSGYKIKYVSSSRVYHVGGATLGDINPKKTFYNFRNSLFLLLKNVESSWLFYVLFIRMLLDGIAAFKFIFEGKLNHFFAILKAHASFYRHYGKIRKKRPKEFIFRKYYLISSVVYSHFILKKNKFNEL
ncbi:glycosyltransferase family 2 protein [Christiangramia forsetii]|uniref:WbbL-like lipopolysaccharide biosynthesis glycosyl transferase n=2 Tax=Christiangramia forsetii TaxID=411153 RepID=A0M3T6_CHRFK|nr:glycosyltransferase family 2 protein [Christiangramia forsetii]GGG25024.1 glycosyl transferase family 2 [Christiangramia forsetii]CAL67281.1 WbbL-like lipopolysaccharide biosynthesis glycosyl transferase [Christiangramia forsetii KT0803]